MEQFDDEEKILKTLEVGADYPRMYREFVKWFPDDEACLTYLEKLRWPNGFTCPACHISAKPWRQIRGRLVCSSCHHQMSATSGTIFEKTHVPLTTSDPAHVSMPGVHRVESLLKRWILGTHQGSVSTEHLQSYVEEFTFRFNRHTSLSRGLVFRRLLEQAVVIESVIIAEITHAYDWWQHNI